MSRRRRDFGSMLFLGPPMRARFLDPFPEDEPAGAGTANPLLNSNGTSRIAVGFGATRTDAVGVVVSEGPMRETRRVHDAEPRVYALPLDQAAADELEAVLEALEVTRGGSVSTKWRHPIDDGAGRIDESPSFRITNAGELGGLALGRESGGARASARLVLEEITH